MSIYVFLNIKTWTVKQLNIHKFYIISRVLDSRLDFTMTLKNIKYD